MAEVKITPQWVEGLRKWIKKTFHPKANYETPEETREHIRHLLKVDLEKLYEYLLYSQGLKVRDDADPKLKSIIDKIRHKIAEELKAAHDALDEGLSYLNWNIEAMTPGSWESEHRPDIRQFYESKPPGHYQKMMVLHTQEILQKVDAILSGRLLRYVSKWLTQYAGGMPFESEPLYLEYNVGKVKVVFDTGRDEEGHSRSPFTFKDYVPELMKAKALLERKGLGDLWYGPMFVSCLKCGGKNPLGEKFGIGASYLIGRDHINIYDDPHENLAGLIIHELGHRYYYKHMNQGDRARFDSYFKEVPATSEYGATISSEDFPEVFKAFVLGRDLTRDQIDRFKAFLTGRERSRFASPRDVADRYFLG